MEFPIGFPWSLGGDALLDGTAIAMAGSTLSYERRIDACADGLALLLNEFDNKPRLRAIACGLLDGVQDVVNAIWQLYTERWIDTGVGGQLDMTGTVLDMPRGGRGDEVYRAFLRARALVLRSDGSWPALVAVLAALGVTLAALAVTYQADSPAAFVVRVRDSLPTDVTGADLFQMLDAAKLGGVRLTLVAPVAAIERTFRFSDAAAYLTSSARGFGDAANPGAGGSIAGAYASSVEV